MGAFIILLLFKCQCTIDNVGNPYLQGGCYGYCMQNPKACKKLKEISGAATGVSSAISALFLVVVCWYAYKLSKKRIDQKRQERFFKRNGGLLLQQKLFSGNGTLEETKMFNSRNRGSWKKPLIVTIRTGFSGKEDKVRFTKECCLMEGLLTVKKSKVIDEGRINQFINEVVILSKINHRNAVKLFGCCLETDVPMLVYEFVPNGTLFQRIHSPSEELLLTWDMRLQIATEVAGALFYMHYAASIPIYHRDIKSTNILLDDKYKAKVSDFGISRSVPIDQTHMTTIVQGTFGYLDPEYFRSNQFTEKSDVYSFRAVIVELLTGRKPVSGDITEECRGLAACFTESMEENKLIEMLDPLIMKKGGWREEMVSVADLAKRCLNMNGKMRPTMKEVAVELEGIRMSRGHSTTVIDEEVVKRMDIVKQQVLIITSGF